MKNHLVLLLATATLLASCGKDTPAPIDEIPASVQAGGATTVSGHFSTAFEQPSANMDAAENNRHLEGDKAFEQTFVTAGSPVHPGIGPLFNQTSCAGCHGKNGRAAFPQSGDDLGGLLLRISIPGAGLYGEPLAVPGFGDQLQQRATFGITPEAQISMQLQTEIRQFLDGEQVSLRRPVFVLVNPYTPLPGDLLSSPRIAPPVIGLGLLEAIKEADILLDADEQDSNGDGISGKPNWVWDAENQQVALGRFGWKASQPNIRQQTAAAFNGDMGITTTYYSTENSAGQPQGDGEADDPEVDEDFLKVATFYTQSLAVPARRDWDVAQVQAGEKLFQETGCAKCHRPSYTTGQHPEFGFLSQQRIYPYTDLLLHDMGEGLADGRPDFAADGREWRTPPLWGIGLTQLVNGHTDFLHDGRARNLTEAILWHGGEGEAAMTQFKGLSKAKREELLAFLNSL